MTISEYQFFGYGTAPGQEESGMIEKQATEQHIRELFAALRYGRQRPPADFYKRKIIATPFDGSYGTAGAVIVVEGTPPHGTIISLESNNNGQFIPAAVFYLTMDSSRRLGSGQAKTVRRYLAAWLPEQFRGWA